MKKFKHAKGEFRSEKMPLIMGILNVTPDSFSDGGIYNDKDFAIEHCQQMILQGADIIDVGAMSTRPGSEPITAAQEIERLKNILPAVCKIASVVSIDTVYPETAEFALSSGVSIVNDVSGEFNIVMAEIVKKYSAGWVMTHTKPQIDDEISVTANVKRFFCAFIEECEKFGIDKSYICLDPGFGFSKDTEQNIYMLKHFEDFVCENVTVMAALSRKRFLGEIAGITNAAERDSVSALADFQVLLKGADIIRVHNVDVNKKMLNIYNSINKNI